MTGNIISSLVLSFFCVLVSCKSNERSSFTGKEVVLNLKTSSDNLRNSEGAFMQLKDGRILFVYTHFTGGQDDHSKAFLAGRYSDDEGKTWTTQDEVILPNEGDMNIMSVSLIRMPDGGIAMYYLRKNSMEDCIPYLRKSYDEAKTWSDPTAVIQDKKGYFVLNNDRVIYLDNGRILAPVSLHNAPGAEWNNHGKIFCYYSDDNGATWKSSDEVPNPEEIMLQEPGVIALNNGTVMMFIRTDSQVQYLSYSEDEGETWSPVVPSVISSPRAPASIKRIPATGDLLLVWNNNRGTEQLTSRTHFNTAISSDEGKSWKHIRTVADTPQGLYCYYAIEFIDGGVLLGHIAEWTNDKSSISAQVTRISLDWLYEGPPPYLR